VRAILFDVGGTLLSEDGYDLEAGVRAALRAPGVERAALHPKRWARELEAWVRGVVGRGHAELSLAGWVRARLRPGAEGDVDLDALEDRLWLAGVRMSAAPGTREVLERASARGLLLAAVSNTIFSARRMRLALEEAGLAKPLRFVLSSSDVGCAKPDPEIFRIALERLGTRAADTLFVGDSWENDVVGASEAGMEAVWISALAWEGADRAHRRIAAIAELSSLLEHA